MTSGDSWQPDKEGLSGYIQGHRGGCLERTIQARPLKMGDVHICWKRNQGSRAFPQLAPYSLSEMFQCLLQFELGPEFSNEEHWPLCGSCVYCYLYLWGSSSHRTRYHKPHNVFLATQHTYLCVLLWCSFRDFQMFIPTKHLGPTSILTFCGLSISSQEKFHKDKTRWPDLDQCEEGRQRPSEVGVPPPGCSPSTGKPAGMLLVRKDVTWLWVVQTVCRIASLKYWSIKLSVDEFLVVPLFILVH